MASSSCSARMLARGAVARSATPPSRQLARSTASVFKATSQSVPFSTSVHCRRQEEQHRQQQSGSAQQQPSKAGKDKWSRHRTQYNYDPFTLHPEEKHYTYPLVTAAELAERPASQGRPREVRMLARDFIHDSLYNPNYGYFTKQAVLLPEPTAGSSASTSQSSLPKGQKKRAAAKQETNEKTLEELGLEEEMGLLKESSGFEFANIRNESEFMRLVEERYASFEEQISVLVEEKANVKAGIAQSEQFDKDLLEERRQRRLRRSGSSDSQATVESTGSERVAAHSAAGLELAQARGRAMMARGEGVQEAEVQSMAAKQVWHTPTQIFRPWYGRALARYLVSEYKLYNYPYQDLIVYELGAGSGALANDILDYLEQHEPEIYTRTRYRIVEISSRLAAEQTKRLAKHCANNTVEVVNKSILDWNTRVQEPCFVIALEVLDNLAHDVVRYDTATLQPYQALVSIDDTGDMHELYQPIEDPLIREYLDILASQDSASSAAGSSSPPLPQPLRTPLLRMLPDKLRRGLIPQLPFYPNLSQAHYLPTSSLTLLKTLKEYFPAHRLVMSDFDALPDTCSGINAPVVQTRHRGTMIPVTTYLVLQGYFDIFFPTNFEQLRHTYMSVLSQSSQRHGDTTLPHWNWRHLDSNPVQSARGYFDSFSPSFNPTTANHVSSGSKVKILSHPEFLSTYAEVDKTTLADSSNPMLSWYQNASWFLS